MTLRTFRTREEVWKWKAETGNHTAGMRGYALKQSTFYGELARRALSAFQPCLYVSAVHVIGFTSLKTCVYIQDKIVTLRWSDTWLDRNVNSKSLLPDRPVSPSLSSLIT